MIGIILYLLTTAFFPIWFYVLLFIWIFFFKKSRYQVKLRNNSSILNQIKLFMFLSSINFTIHIFLLNKIEIPQFVFIPMIIYLAFTLERKDINYIVPLICIEGLVGLLEFAADVPSFFPQFLQSSEDAFMADEELLYFKRVAGLSPGVSSYGLKLMVGIVLCDLTSYKNKRLNSILQFFLFVCLVMSFHRTSLVAIMIYFVWKYFMICKRENKMSYFFIGCFILTYLSTKFIDFDFIFSQFTRNTGHIELSGRDEIWSQSMNHIYDHFLEGNGSFRYRMPYHGVTAHCHNSFIQMLANNGIFIGGFYLWIMLHKLNRSNFVYALPLLMSSVTQYFLFNGCSFQDIIYVLILFKDDILNDYKVNSNRELPPITA